MLKKGVLIGLICLFLMGILGIMGCTEQSTFPSGRTTQPEQTQPEPSQTKPTYKSEEVINMSMFEFDEIINAYMYRDEGEEEFANLIGKTIRIRGRLVDLSYGLAVLESLERNERGLPHISYWDLSNSGFDPLFENLNPPGLKPKYLAENYEGSIATLEFKFLGFTSLWGSDMVCEKITMEKDGRVFERESR